MERLSLVSFPCLLLQLSATRQTYAQASATFRVHAEMTVLLFCKLLRRANPPAQGRRRGTFIKKKGGLINLPLFKKTTTANEEICVWVLLLKFADCVHRRFVSAAIQKT